MTPYSTTSETPPKPKTNLSPDGYHPEVNAADWESQMARLVGLAVEPTTDDVESTADLAIAERSSSTPEQARTEQPLATNPFAKLALVGTATLAVVVLAGGFLSQLMSSGNQKTPKNNQAVAPAESLATNLSPEANLEQEVETLKTKLALAEQAQGVKAAQQNLRNLPRPTAAAPTNNPVVRVTQQTTPTSTTPRTVIVERVVQNPYQPRPLPVATSVITPQQLPPPPPLAANPLPSPPNPLQEWTRLSKLGSYGQASITEQPPSSVGAVNPVSTNDPEMQQQPINPNPYQGRQRPNPFIGQTPQQNPGLVSQASSRNPASLKVGTTAKAVLATAVFGETTRSRGNDDNNENPNLFVVRLQQPLKGVDGAIALPANTELLTQVRSISEQGVIQLILVKAIVQDNGNLSERDLPTNALTIRAPQGRPLLAQQYPDRGGSIASMDVGLFALGGLAKAAELFNRTESQVSVNGGSTVVTNNNIQRNIPAGVVEGGLNSVVPQISQRNQQAIAQMMQQTNVWILKAGTEVEIYVNQSIQL
ncbi:TrbI/VirB10 family protein [Nostoc sp. TCL26-01]|uniref:TrbI/VirB10 family protein n=1 Tax=Nostoc sp. TCL26-01 TaxID=2576904 RepID=UPI0015BBBA1C|nr:TrbI/VirB10 family protein [Nostoc sp. TCL26-01]QLE55676.1 TrbI/VirB10 family protein [Nostoc sp. TCL26-01]